MSANSSKVEAQTIGDDSREEEILDNISNLIDKKLELSLAAYTKSLSTNVDFSSLISGYRFELECDRLKIQVYELINTHESNLKEVIKNELGLMNETYPGDLKTDPKNLGVSRRDVKGSNSMRLDGRSPMAPKFLVADDDDIRQVDNAFLDMQEAAERENKTPYFLYGSLMDVSTLRRVLGLEERPQLRPASITGYHIKMWGPYPVLQDGPPGNVVHGMMWEVEGAKRKDRLAEYETSNYKERGCIIKMKDGNNVRGTTFMWNGDASELKQGTFDLKDWQMNQLDHA